MMGKRVVDVAANPVMRQMSHQGGPEPAPQHAKMGYIVQPRRQDTPAGMGLAQAADDRTALCIPAIQARQFQAEDRSLYLVQAAVAAARPRGMILGLPSVLPQFTRRPGDRPVVRDDRAGVAQRTEILRRIKAEAAGGTERASFFAAELGAMGLAAVFDDRDIAARQNVCDRTQIR